MYCSIYTVSFAPTQQTGENELSICEIELLQACCIVWMAPDSSTEIEPAPKVPKAVAVKPATDSQAG